MDSAFSIPPNILLLTIVLLVFLYLLSKLWQTQLEPNIRVIDVDCSHHWEYTDMVLHLPLHCNICHTFLLTSKGQFCSNCGIGCCIQASCINKVNATHKCKAISSDQSQKIVPQNDETNKKFRHHWIPGNLPLHSECEVCEEVCGDGPGIVDLRCCWCQRTVHNQCQSQMGEVCDYGEFRNLIVSPQLVTSKSNRTIRNPKRRVIDQVTPDLELGPKWHPLIVIGNKKSGNKDCTSILAAFRSQLNPAQVVDLDESKMDDGLKWFRLLDDYSEIKSYCVVAGGDGTVGWVLNTLDKMNLKNPPTLALLPLGTGNDLARSLGYGPGEDASLNVRDFLRKIVNEGIEINGLDRWHVQVNPYRHFGIQLPSHDFYMQNYVSIGVDALVTYNFHKARESPFYLISSRIINKLIYFSYGTKDVLERECKNLNQILELYIDDQRVKLPPIESVVILNIPCWGAGVRPWSLGSEHKNFPEPTISDGLLEVFCVYSSFHIAQMQVGLSEPHRIGQARSVKIKLRGSAPMQIDGEPWEQHPAEIDINFHNKIPVLQLQSQ